MTTHEAPVLPETIATLSTRTMSFDDYIALDHENGIKEWVDGEVIESIPPKNEHQTIVAFLDRLLGIFVQMFHLGKVQIAPFTMRAVEGGAAREPDLMYIAAANLDKLLPTHFAGAADLVVEVISDESVSRDRAEKFYEYQDIGVREYWIIDPRPNRQRLDCYVLDEQGAFQPVPIGADGVYHSHVLPHFWLRVEWLWQDTSPLHALAAIVGHDALIAALR